MQKMIRFILAAIVVALLLAYMATYTVRFTEAAVLTTFGRAGDGSVKRDAGLYFKMPYPIQSVTTYDTRTRLLELKIETQQTADNRQVAVEAFCMWRVSDPLKFFQTFVSAGEQSEAQYRRAEDALRANLRSAAGVVSNYTMNDLLTTSAGQSRLPELEQRMLQAFRAGSDQEGTRLDDYGITAVEVGITRVLLPEEVTKAVFDRMKSGRERLAKEIESQGMSQAQAIREKAKADAKRINAFAERLAQEIRQRGDLEAAPYLKTMDQNPQLASYLIALDFIREMDPRSTTLVLPSSLPGLDLLMPDALANLKPGEIPQITPGALIERVAQPQAAPASRPAPGGRPRGDAGMIGPDRAAAAAEGTK